MSNRKGATVQEVADSIGTDYGYLGDFAWQLHDGNPVPLVARHFSGHYTIPEIEAILKDMKRVQKAWEEAHAAEIAALKRDHF
jgi:hypothetical protein